MTPIISGLAEQNRMGWKKIVTSLAKWTQKRCCVKRKCKKVRKVPKFDTLKFQNWIVDVRLKTLFTVSLLTTFILYFLFCGFRPNLCKPGFYSGEAGFTSGVCGMCSLYLCAYCIYSSMSSNHILQPQFIILIERN